MATQNVGAFVRTSLHVAAVADSTGAEMLVQQGGFGAYTHGAFQVSGTVTTATISFEATVDGTNWVALECRSGADSTVVATSATAAGLWLFDARGLYKVRANLDWTAGSVTVWGSLAS